MKFGLSWVEYNGGWNDGMLECGNVGMWNAGGNTGGNTGMMEWLEWWNGVHANYLELLKKDRKNTSV